MFYSVSISFSFSDYKHWTYIHAHLSSSNQTVQTSHTDIMYEIQILPSALHALVLVLTHTTYLSLRDLKTWKLARQDTCCAALLLGVGAYWILNNRICFCLEVWVRFLRIREGRARWGEWWLLGVWKWCWCMGKCWRGKEEREKGNQSRNNTKQRLTSTIPALNKWDS